MRIGGIDLRAELRRVRAAFDEQLAEILRHRTELTHAQIGQQFGVSNKVIRRVSGSSTSGVAAGWVELPNTLTQVRAHVQNSGSPDH